MLVSREAAKPRSREVAKGNAQVRCSVFGGRAADGSPRVLRVAAEAISAFNFLQSTLYGMDAIAPHPRRLSSVPGRGENLVASCQFLVFSYGAFLRGCASSRETNRC